LTDCPVRLDAGETLPHWEAVQAVFQFTPLLVVSCWMVAVTAVFPPAGTELEAAETDTVMTGGGGPMELLPLQLVRKGMSRNARMDKRKDAARFMAPPRGSQFAGATTGPPKRGSETAKWANTFRT
jgi:hypothetical protein